VAVWRQTEKHFDAGPVAGIVENGNI
jgi:hypothetical protein